MNLADPWIEARTESEDEMTLFCLDVSHEPGAVVTAICQKKLVAKLTRRGQEMAFALLVGGRCDTDEVVAEERQRRVYSTAAGLTLVNRPGNDSTKPSCSANDVPSWMTMSLNRRKGPSLAGFKTGAQSWRIIASKTCRMSLGKPGQSSRL
jgi:hypothetical protein